MRYPEHLTKEKAIELHRLLWNYIADESERTGTMILKSDAFEHFEWPNVKALCWCCKYCDFKCSKCPIEWPQESCVNEDSPFNKWRNAKERIYMCSADDEVRYQKYLKLYIKYAREIANLPERKKQDGRK